MTTIFKYKLIKIRSKISFMARKLRMTISELILNQIHSSYTFLIKHEEIQKNIYDEYISRDEIFEKFLSSGSSSIFRFIMHINAHCSCNKEDQKRLARQQLLEINTSTCQNNLTSIIRNGSSKVKTINSIDDEQKT